MSEDTPVPEHGDQAADELAADKRNPDELGVEQWDDDDIDEAADMVPPQPADGGAFLAEADKHHDQADYDQAEADRQLDAVDDDEGE